MPERYNGAFITGCPMLQHDEEMGDFSKSQFIPAAGGPFVDAILRLPQYLVYTRPVDMLSVQQDFPVKGFI
ncbi:MAG: hypothetical protein WBO58_00845 [Gammaproteobacteria bacterium]